MMKKLILFSFVLLFATACQPLRFDRYPGTSQKEIPEKYRGKYESPKDTVTIWVGKNSYTYIEKNKTEIYFLDSTHVFSSYKNYDFLSWKEEGKWYCSYVKKKGDNTMSILLVMPPSKQPASHNYHLLKKYFTSIDTISKSNVKSSKWVFDETPYNVQMNEEELIKYLKKIKKRNLTLKKAPL